jgi:hypothetical protein
MIKALSAKILVELEKKFPNDADFGREVRKWLKSIVGD